jgi:flagellar assembly factor FliW
MVFDVKASILGFDELVKVELKKIDDFFSSLKNADKAAPGFTLINPYALREYSFDIPSSIRILLDLKENSKVEVYNIVVLQNPMDKSVVNFIAPLIFNHDNMTMGQVVLEAGKYVDFGVAEEISTYLQK